MARHARIAFVGSIGSELEDELAWQMRLAKLPPFETQYKFHPDRKWAADFAWPEYMLLVEVEGDTWVGVGEDGKIKGGRHVRGKGFEEDCVKYAEAAILGYRVVRLTSKLVKDARGLDLVERALAWTPDEELAA